MSDSTADKSPELTSENQKAQHDMVQEARALPGVAALMEVYGSLAAYHTPTFQPGLTHNAIGGNAG